MKPKLKSFAFIWLTLCGLGLLMCFSAAAAGVWQTVSGGFRLEWSDAELRYLPVSGGKPVSLFEPFSSESDMKCTQERSLKPLSLAGPYLSLLQEEYWNCEGTAHPGAYSSFRTLDLRSGKPLQLTQLFAEAAVLKALLAEPVIARTLKAAGRSKPASARALVEELLKLNDRCEYAFDAEMLSHFAFHHLQGKQVAVRIGLSHGCEVARGNLTQLGFYLPIPAALEHALVQAGKGQGLLMIRGPARESASRSHTDPGYQGP
ncbi:MAG: hypothetical protein ACAI44_39625 [Candidatus Sericytochromatia bacterium]